MKKGRNQSNNRKGKSKVPEVTQWSFVKSCTHDLTCTVASKCVMCKLVEQETQAWLNAEKERATYLKAVGLYKRADMRYGLLLEWARNEISLISDVLNIPVGEITLNGAITEALSSVSEEFQDFSSFSKLLDKRIRILEVGDFAAIKIQAKVRSIFCRQRVKTFMLRRFQYVHESNKRPAHFLDKKTGYKWHYAPVFLRSERPGSPSTIERRLRAQEMARQKRNDANQKVLFMLPKIRQASIWEYYEYNMQYVRQILIFRDTISILIKNLNIRRRDLGERPTIVKKDRNAESQMSNPATSFPVWFTFSNPAPPYRQLFMSLALKTDPLIKEDAANKDATESFDTNNGSNQLKTTEEIPPTLQLNERFQMFDKRIWEEMECSDCDEVAHKVLLCDEVFPAMSSVSQIAEDEHSIWDYRSSANREDLKEALLSSYKGGVEVLPMQLHLFPFHPNHSPAGILRLFIIDEVLVGVSHSSSWTFYSEIWKYRNSIVSAIYNFVETSQVQRLIRTLSSRANSVDVHNESDNSSSTVVSLLLPQDKNIFGSSPKLGQSQLVSDELELVENKYNFLKSLHDWRKYKYQHRTNRRKSVVPMIETIRSQEKQDVVPVKTVALPNPDDLLGTNALKLLIQSAPSSSIDEETRHVLGDLKGSAAYSNLMRKIINSQNGKMFERIHEPTVSSNVKDVETLVKAKPYDLIVLDVHVGVMDEGSSLQAISASSTRKTVVAGGVQKRKEVKFGVELHHVVGVYSTFNPRPPARIDLGLFTWTSLCKLKNPSSRPKLDSDADSSDWLPLNAHSGNGVHYLNSPNPNKIGQHVQFRLISQPLTREYVEANVPRKVRVWLGLKY